MRTIEIDNLILVEVPKDVTNFEVFAKKDNVDYEIIGLIETPNVDFDFDVDESWVSIRDLTPINSFGKSLNIYTSGSKKQSFRTHIQMEIQDAGIELTGNLLPIKKLQ